MTAVELMRSPLHERHVAAGARFAPFAGWSMPVEYAAGGVLAEHAAVRCAAGLFDVSHLGTVSVRGPGAAAFLNRCLTADVARIGPGRAQYTLLCADDGGVVDDLFLYLINDDDVLLIPNAANCAEVVTRLAGVARGVEVVNRHAEVAVLAVQGPRSDDVLSAAGLPAGHDYLSFVPIEHGASTVLVCRTGYTGERGYELLLPADRAAQMWDELLRAGAPYGLQPAGLGARDTLRTEMGYALHGQDISPQISPVQARLGWAVGWSKPEFWGAEALRAERAAGPARVLRGLRATGRGIPRPGMRVVRRARIMQSAPVATLPPVQQRGRQPADVPADAAGVITSGTFSPTLRTGIALALLAPDLVEGAEVEVEVRGRHEPFVVVRPPFVTPGVRA